MDWRSKLLIISLVKIEWSLFVKSLSLKDALCQVWPCGSREKECYTWLMYLHYKLFPLGKGHSSLFEENLNPFLQKYCFPSLIEITSGSGDEDFIIFSIYFPNFVKICSRKRGWSFI